MLGIVIIVIVGSLAAWKSSIQRSCTLVVSASTLTVPCKRRGDRVIWPNCGLRQTFTNSTSTPESDSAPANVLRFVGFHKKVLEIGAGPGSIARPIAERNNYRVTAVELDEK